MPNQNVSAPNKDTLSEWRTLTYWAKNWPARPDGIHVSVVYRFAKRGVGGIRLATTVVPGAGLCCRAEDIERFIEAVSAASAPATPAPRKPRRPLLRDRLAGGPAR